MDMDTLSAIAQIAGNLTTQAVLLAWVFREMKRSDSVFAALQEDWQRQREREISRQDAKNGGSGL
jgi:hypothetical protein